MSNVLGNYNPTFFANEALDQLYKALGFAGRVHRGIEEERSSTGRNLGDTVNLRRPGKFDAQDHVPGVGSNAQDLQGQNVQVTLDSHKEVKFKVTDRELAYTSERIINEHIKPAAYALADKIDSDLHAMGDKVGPQAVITTTDSSSITGPRKVLRNNECPMDSIHYLIDAGMEAAYLDSPIFHQANTTGQGNNEGALMNGSLGRRFGVEIFATQNADVTPSVKAGTAAASAGAGDRIGAVNNAAGYPVNTGTIAVDGFGGVETVDAGDTFTIAGDPTVYILTAGGAFAGGAQNFTFYPALRKNVADNAVITLVKRNAVEEAAHYRNLMFHRNAFALAFAPLPTTGDGRGAQIDTVTDEITGLSVRARMWYDGDTATNLIALDTLYGKQVLDGQMAVRVLRAQTLAPAG